MSEGYESWRDKKKAADEALREQLKDCNLDGPYKIETGNLFDGSMLFGQQGFLYAICDICGATIKLDDPIEMNGLNIERGVHRHTQFHNELRPPQERIDHVAQDA